MTVVCHEQHHNLRWKDASPEDAIFDDAHECERIKLAIRVVYIMKEYKLFEEGTTKEETETIKRYFTSTSRENPTTTIIALIDKSIGNALREMRHHPERFNGDINDDVKKFIKRSRKAKPVLLDAMIAYACIPDCWGGVQYDKTVTARLAESKMETVDKQKADENQKKEGESKEPKKADEQKDRKEEEQPKKVDEQKDRKEEGGIMKKEGENEKQEGRIKKEPGAKETPEEDKKADGKEVKKSKEAAEKPEKEEIHRKQKSERNEQENKPKARDNPEAKQEKRSKNQRDVQHEKTSRSEVDGKSKTTAKEGRNEKHALQEDGHGLLDFIWKLLGKRSSMKQRRIIER
ncbi:hypothetical protein GCK32_008458 [Trichostrongylus colubriformis]|uniref:DUF7774 domain-containing protein n=1 Tax=Trichostrongylus colubriformis TaxID=6319 RepID=A0AAN8FWS7_TRICO